VRDRPTHTTGGAVAGDREGCRFSTAPRLAQRVRYERERAGLARNVLEHEVDEPGLQTEPNATRRLLHRGAQLVRTHRTEQRVARRDHRRESRVLGAATIEVGPERDHDCAGRIVSRGCLDQ
jgi:hypothetical protein